MIRSLQLVTPTLIPIWLVLVGIGLWWLWEYESTPSPAGSPPADWPVASKVKHSSNQPTLLMFAHPRCPCTRASIGELARIMARCQGQVDANVLFLATEDTDTEWAQTDLWESARKIPGVTLIVDNIGSEARLFQVTTSGDTVLYDTNGQLLFHGGITSSRGHFGDNSGRSSIISLLTDGTSSQKHNAVYGCSLCKEHIEFKKDTKP